MVIKEKLDLLKTLWRFPMKGSMRFLRHAGFTADDILAFATREREFADWSEKLEPRQLTESERERIFLEDGSVTTGEAHESRRQYLENELIDVSKSGADTGKIQRIYDSHVALKTSKIDQSTINRAKQRKISDYIKVRVGFAKCPFHKEKTGSLSVNKTDSLWHCFGCGEGGDIITFIMKLKEINFVEAVKYLS